jgi:hypothetical protein
MPWDDPDPQDPMTLVGTVIPCEDAAETSREMAWAFAEEFARLGHGEAQILALFRSPFYAGAYGALQILGENEINTIVAETSAVWGRLRFVDRDANPLAVLPNVEGIEP